MKPTITQYKDESNDVLVIFDTDTNNNDYALLMNEIFLFPDNKNDGALEGMIILKFWQGELKQKKIK
jgi:hypothetical protein